MTAEFYNCAVEVMRGAEAIDEYVACRSQEAFDIEYWLLEEAKLQRMPAEKELARHVVVVIGAGSGIGKAVAHRVAPRRRARRLRRPVGRRRRRRTAGRADEDATASASAWPAPASPAAARRSAWRWTSPTARACSGCVHETVLAYGGLDNVIVTAGIFAAPGRDRPHHRRDSGAPPSPSTSWAATSSPTKPAGLGGAGAAGSLVLTTSVNAWSPRRARRPTTPARPRPTTWCANWRWNWHRWCASTAWPRPPWCRAATMFPRDRVMSSLTKYEIAFDPDESADALRGQAGRQFYAAAHADQAADHARRSGRGGVLPAVGSDRPHHRAGANVDGGLRAIGRLGRYVVDLGHEGALVGAKSSSPCAVRRAPLQSLASERGLHPNGLTKPPARRRLPDGVITGMFEPEILRANRSPCRTAAPSPMTMNRARGGEREVVHVGPAASRWLGVSSDSGGVVEGRRVTGGVLSGDFMGTPPQGFAVRGPGGLGGGEV